MVGRYTNKSVWMSFFGTLVFVSLLIIGMTVIVETCIEYIREIW